MRTRRDIDCHYGHSRALAIGEAVESIERSGEEGEVLVHDGYYPERIVICVTVELVDEREEPSDA